MGVDLIVLTGNPGNGVSNELIVEALKAISAAVGDRVLLAAGKMHASGVAGEGGEKIMTPADAEAFMAAGADIILLPAPGTVPGITQEYAHRLIEVVHSRGKLALTAIGTSQEGADVATIRQIALMCKMAGADIHHALAPEVREGQEGRGVQKVESCHLLRLRDGGEVHDLVGLQQAVGKLHQLGHGVLGQVQGGETLTEDGFHQFFPFSRSRISVRSFSSAEGSGGAAGSSAFFLASLSWKPLTAFSRQKMAKAMSTKSRMVAMREP